MPPNSTLRTPITGSLTLSRIITPDAITVEIHDDGGKAVYAEEIATRSSPTEPANPEQVEPIL